MSQKKFIQLRNSHVFAALLLLCLFFLIGIMPGTVQAAEFPNPSYTFTSTKDTAISTQANPGETTVLIFGHTGCGFTRSTLDSVSRCSWVSRSDIRVIFADVNGHTKEEVQSYEDGYACPDMNFCYDEDDVIFFSMVDYFQKAGKEMEGNTYPAIVLIDKNNKVRDILTGKKTAEEILNEIKKFEPIDGGETTPPEGSGGLENFAYGLNTIEGTTISTKANRNETTVLLFGNTGCPNTAAALREIDASSWVSRSDIRVIYADLYGADLSKTKQFADNYPGGNIIFCHDESALNLKHALSYLGLINETGGPFPFIILIDQYNKVQSITMGYQTADQILQAIEKFTNQDQNTKPETTVADVTGFAAVSAAKNVKLTWNAVSKAAGYEIYQYNKSKKSWVMKAVLDASAVSYTVKGLTPATEYRFAVRAFIKPQNKETVYSKTYVSLDTATAPKAVNFKVKPGKKKVKDTWSKVKGAAGYTVFYKTKANASWKKLKNLKKTSFTKSKLKSGKTYFFTVKAYKKYKGKTYTGSSPTKKAKVK